MNAIEVRHLGKQFRKYYDKTLKGYFISLAKRERLYEQFHALDDVSFTVKEAEAFAIIGDNGAGKSTLFKILCGIISKDRGDMRINGKIAPLIELSAGLSRDLSGKENIRLNCAIFGLKREQIEVIYPEIVAFAELEEFIDTPVKFYSSGMKARLGFSIAVHIDAEIILIDEVLAVGDAQFRKKCYTKMQELKQAGKTIVIISHSLKPLKTICDRALILQKGKVVAIGDANEMIEQYESGRKQRGA